MAKIKTTDHTDYSEERLQAALDAVQAEPVDNENEEVIERYDSMLDEHYSFEYVGGPFSVMSPAKVLKEFDPITYREGLADFIDSLEKDDQLVRVGPDYYSKKDVEEAVELMEDEDAEAEAEEENKLSVVVGDLDEGDIVVLNDGRRLYVQTTPADNRDSFFASVDREGNKGWYFHLSDVKDIDVADDDDE